MFPFCLLLPLLLLFVLASLTSLQGIGAFTVSSSASSSSRRRSSATKAYSYLVGRQQQQQQQQQETLLADILNPPRHLNELKVGDSLNTEKESNEKIEIEKVCDDPPIFIARNFLSSTECHQLMEDVTASNLLFGKAEVDGGGQESHRVGSNVAWIDWDECDNDDSEDPYDGSICKASCSIAHSMALKSAGMFFHPIALQGNGIIEGENLQIVHYKQTGKFDIHHDGHSRVLTCLTYLNGVAMTWFPFANDARKSIPYNDMLDYQHEILEERKLPGRDGLCILGTNDDVNVSIMDSDYVVRIKPGDSVVFYNYQYDDNNQRAGIRWKSLHCGLPATREKWIATNWFNIS